MPQATSSYAIPLRNDKKMAARPDRGKGGSRCISAGGVFSVKPTIMLQGGRDSERAHNCHWCVRRSDGEGIRQAQAKEERRQACRAQHAEAEGQASGGWQGEAGQQAAGRGGSRTRLAPGTGDAALAAAEAR